MNVNDALGIGKVLPIDKLIEVLSKSVGKISKSYFDKKDVDTKAYEIEKLAEARANEMKIIANAVKENFLITGGIEYKDEKIAISSPKDLPIQTQQQILITPELDIRTNDRLNYQEAKKQLNIENVTAFAAEQLKNEPPITDEPLNEDWTTRFFKIAEEVSNEEMQTIWGKILAGEIKQPNSYSLRTLELIRNLSKQEAQIFIKVARFAFNEGGKNYIFKTNKTSLLSDKYGITYEDITLLTEIGLIQSGDTMTLNFISKEVDVNIVLRWGNILAVTEVKKSTPSITMPVYSFTTAGNELLRLVESSVNHEYLKEVIDSIKGENIRSRYGYRLGYDGDNIICTPLKDFE